MKPLKAPGGVADAAPVQWATQVPIELLQVAAVENPLIAGVGATSNFKLIKETVQVPDRLFECPALSSVGSIATSLPSIL
jgi:hypothetical protein